MSVPSADDELLAILLTNLRNAAATFGEGTPPYESVRTTIEEHLSSMKAAGKKTNVSSIRSLPSQAQATAAHIQQPSQTPMSFSNLAFRPKPT